jgi:hypothetical protein
MSNATLEVTTNPEQELYVIPCNVGRRQGYTCLGFEVCLRRASAIAAWLRQEGQPAEDVPADLRGTLDAYHRYCDLLVRAGEYCRQNDKRCPVELTPQLVGSEGRRVEVVDCCGQRRRFIVGRSTGWLPCHLEIARRNSSGGPAVMGTPFQSVRVVG